MENLPVKAILIAAISATIGLIINLKTPTLQAAITVPMTAWLLFQFRGYEKAWSSLANFQNPILFAINTFFLSFIYTSWRTIPLMKAIYLSTGVFLLGAVLSLLIHKYWNIGG